MSKVLVNINGLSHDEWINIRRSGIGGSDVGAICGLNPWASAIDVYMDKLGLKDEKPDNEAMRQGRDLEEYVAKRFEEATGKKVRRRNAILQHDEHDFMLANIDRWLYFENAGLECKTASVYAASDWADGKIPAHYELQCHHYMAVTGADKWYLCCLILNKSLELREIPRDEEVIKQIIAIEKSFWNDNVLAKIMPAPDGSDAATAILKSIYKDSNPDEIVELNGYEDKLKRFDEIVELEDILGTEKELIKQEVMVKMGEAETAICGRRKITWKKQAGRKSFDNKALQVEMPDI